MSTMVKSFCDSCGTQCSDVSLYDLPYILETKCWDCVNSDELWNSWITATWNKGE